MSNEPYFPLMENLTKIERMFGKDFLLKSMYDQLTIDEYLYANDELAKYCYGSTVAELIKNRQIEKLCMLYNDLLCTMPNRNLSNNINLDELGIILLRPETIGKKQEYMDLLKKIKLSVIYEKKIKLNFQQYWVLYHQGLIHENSLEDFPTRTFNYINNECCLLVMTGNRDILQAPTISDYLFSVKGKHGSYCKNTLRGDIAFNSLLPYTIDKTTLIQEANVPLDPIGAYRMLVRGLLKSDGWHDNADMPILFYCGQAVHIPNRYEINKDMNVLCNDEDIDIISKKLKKR